MVDPTKGIGGIQNLPSSSNDRAKTDAKKSDGAGGTSSSTPIEISLSEEAISLSAAEQATQNARADLENNPDVTLGSEQRLAELLA